MARPFIAMTSLPREVEGALLELSGGQLAALANFRAKPRRRITGFSDKSAPCVLIAGTVKTEADLNQLTTEIDEMKRNEIKSATLAELVAEYNKHSDKPVKKFRDRSTAEKRVAAFLPKEGAKGTRTKVNGTTFKVKVRDLTGTGMHAESARTKVMQHLIDKHPRDHFDAATIAGELKSMDGVSGIIGYLARAEMIEVAG